MRSRLLATVAAVAVVLVLAGCGAASEPGPAPTASASPTSDGRLLKFKLPYLEDAVKDPNALDLARHAAGDAPLLLFLPATGQVPADYEEFLGVAVAEGYSVLGLDYWNTGLSVARTCGTDAGCYTELQQNRYDGTDPSRFSRVDVANSILRRFQAAIAWLERHDPEGAWGRYLDADRPAWSRIVLAGHSQGGGESAFLSHFHVVQGVLMFSSPVETDDDVAASWITTRGATPVSRMYGFDDVHDMYYGRITDSWRRLGMGDPDPARATDVPTGSHVLLSSRDVGTPAQSHGASVDDAGPRYDDLRMVFAPTWRWMLRQVRSP